jgi:hypothetical protein
MAELLVCKLVEQRAADTNFSCKTGAGSRQIRNMYKVKFSCTAGTVDVFLGRDRKQSC